MIRHLASGLRRAVGLHRPGHRMPVRADDILLASYPKSGEDWLQSLIANLVHPTGDVAAERLHQVVIDPDRSTKRDFDNAPRPRFVKAHASFDPRYRRVIYLVRDPRDVASHGASIDRFLEGRSGNLVDDFGSWGENAGSWLATGLGRKKFLLVRAEDLSENPVRELSRIRDFAGLGVDGRRIEQAIQKSEALKPARSGWPHRVPAEWVTRIEAQWGEVMACLGYKLVTGDAGRILDASLLGLLTAGDRNTVPVTPGVGR